MVTVTAHSHAHCLEKGDAICVSVLLNAQYGSAFQYLTYALARAEPQPARGPRAGCPLK